MKKLLNTILSNIRHRRSDDVIQKILNDLEGLRFIHTRREDEVDYMELRQTIATRLEDLADMHKDLNKELLYHEKHPLLVKCHRMHRIAHTFHNELYDLKKESLVSLIDDDYSDDLYEEFKLNIGFMRNVVSRNSINEVILMYRNVITYINYMIVCLEEILLNRIEDRKQVPNNIIP